MSIWLDVTTIVGWNRPPVGVIRTEVECARYFVNQRVVDVRFCRFEKAERRYLELSREFVVATLSRLDSSRDRARVAQRESSSAPGASIRLTKGQRLRRGLRRSIDLLPTPVRLPISRFASARREAFFAMIRVTRESRLALRVLLKSSAPAAIRPPEPQHHPVPFDQSDVYVSLGLDWDQKDLTYLYQEKQRLNFKVVLFCYDLIPVRLPHLCVSDVAAMFSSYFTNVARCADRVLCISECTRRDLTDFLSEVGASTPSLAVVRLGSELPDAEEPVPSSEIAELVGKPYILFVSTIERRKNHETLYRAYTRLITQGITDLPRLVFVGMPGWGVHDLMLDLKLDRRIQAYIRILNNLTDEDLGVLYRHAYFTAFPSLFEGWGLPVAESLSYGKFCLASNSSSIPEVGGDLLEYLDPWDVSVWAERLAWYFQHPEAVAERERRIRAEYRPTAWSEAAKVVLEQAILASREVERAVV